jgi:amidase
MRSLAEQNTGEKDMKGQSFLKSMTMLALSAALLTAGLPVAHAATPAKDAPKPQRPLNIAPFAPAIKSLSNARVDELDAALTSATIPQMQALFAQGKLTSEELVKYYLWRINQYDVNKLNSVTELNPDALDLAKALDAERAAGKVRGPLHGTAVLLIDLIGTGDKLHNTAGAMALQDARSDRDAFVVKRLRDAGVIILGKTSLSEWSGFMGYTVPAGYSVLGGQVANPYNRTAESGGSSTGSAVAAAANFATFTLGEETFGGMAWPAVSNGAAMYKPSMGMISRDRLIPNLPAHDTIGPMTRNLTDLAWVAEALVAADPNDPITNGAASANKDFTKNLNAEALKGRRVGVLPAAADDTAFDERVIAALKQMGAEVVPLPKQPDLVPDVFNDLDPINAFGIKTGVESYLQATNAPMKTISDVVAFNNAGLKARAPFGQEYLQMAATLTMTQQEYNTRLAAYNAKYQQQIDALMAGNKLDYIAGTHVTLPFSINYAAPGYPAVALPIGYRADGAPVGWVLTGKRFNDANLIRAAYALEQSVKAWRAPDLKKWK